MATSHSTDVKPTEQSVGRAITLDGASATPASNQTTLASTRRQRLFKALLLGVALVLIMLYRRPDQFAIPYVWVEDGLVNVPDYLANGWRSLWHPIAGYYCLPVKLAHAIAMSLSFRWLPEIGLAMSLLFTYCVLLAIAFSPTRLRLPALCAVGVLLIPTDAENFAVSLYLGWWGSILSLLPLFWNDESRRNGLRIAFIVVGGLSSPIIVGIAPLYGLRWLLLRKRDEFIAAAVAVAVAGLQYYTVSHSVMAPSMPTAGIDIGLVIEKFFGYFLNMAPNFLQSGLAFWLGLGLIGFIVASWLQHRRELGLTFQLLCLSLVAAIVSSAFRQPLDVIHPVLAGPRYFFFPYILLGWVLIQLASLDKAPTRFVAWMLLAIGLRNMFDGGRRRHEVQDWRANLQACVQAPMPTPYRIPIHFVGQNNHLWYLELTSEQCRQLIKQSLFDNEAAL